MASSCTPWASASAGTKPRDTRTRSRSRNEIEITEAPAGKAGVFFCARGTSLRSCVKAPGVHPGLRCARRGSLGEAVDVHVERREPVNQRARLRPGPPRGFEHDLAVADG